MATGNKQSKITRSMAPKQIFADLTGKVAATTNFTTGDLLCWDSTNNIVYLPTAEANGSTFLGISDSAVVNGVLQGPYTGITDNNSAIPSYVIPGPFYGVYAKATLKTGDSLAVGAVVYLDPASGAQNVSASGTKAIGVYEGASAISSAAAGTVIEFAVMARYPLDTIKF